MLNYRKMRKLGQLKFQYLQYIKSIIFNRFSITLLLGLIKYLKFSMDFLQYEINVKKYFLNFFIFDFDTFKSKN